MIVGRHVSRRISDKYLRTLLYKDIGFFDTLGTGEATARLTDGVHLVRAAASEKTAAMLMTLSTIITAILVSLVKFWKLALLSMSSLVALMLVLGLASRFIGKYSRLALEAHAQSSHVAEETLSSMPVIKALGSAGPRRADAFDDHLSRAVKFGRNAKLALGGLIGGVLAIAMLNVGLILWQGSRYIVAAETSSGAVSTIILSTLIGNLSLVTLAPIIAAIASGLAAASKIFALVDQNNGPADERTHKARILASDEFQGNIEFKNISFEYPSRPESSVLKNVSLTIPAGKVTAIVGASGSGKSTFVNLLQRFYQPREGSVSIDGHEINELDMFWLRRQMGLVDQEPMLFSDTVLHNIAIGLMGSERALVDMTDAEVMDAVVDAAKISGIHEFISSLPGGYHTVLNDGGASLSGGQRQRIAISRAIIRDPKILLLDEPSSALDAKSEKHIQTVVNSSSKGHRTTLVITHRLSTIRNADNIYVIKDGELIEQGSHDELYMRRGLYYALLRAQQPQDAGDGVTEEEKANSSEVHHPRGSTSNSVDPIVTSELYHTDTTSSSGNSFSSNLYRFDSTAYMQNNSIGALLRFLAKMNRQQLPWTIVGLLASLVCGAGTPIHVLFLSHAIDSFTLPTSKQDQMLHDISQWAGLYIALAAILLVANLIQGWALGLSSERLTSTAKGQAFRALLRKDLCFFDCESTSTGAMVNFLATEPTALGGVSGPILGAIVSVCTTILACVSIAIGYGWKLGLVATATVPILLVSGFLRLYLLSRMEQSANATFEKAMSRAREAIAAIRTVASLTLEEGILSKYQEELNIQCTGHILLVAMLYSISFSLFFLCMALIMWYGLELITATQYTFLQLWICFVEIMFSTQSAGTIFAFAPDLARAKEAVKRLKDLLERDEDGPLGIDDSGQPFFGESADKMVPLQRQSGDDKIVDGQLEFRHVEFAYPSRPTHTILKGMSFKVEPGQYVAFVGASGSGKSTIISLLERFYSPRFGAILVDGKSISSFEVEQYRSQLALVNQDICLFRGTIRENILLGVVDGQNIPSEDEIHECCKAANIYDFVMSLP